MILIKKCTLLCFTSLKSAKNVFTLPKISNLHLLSLIYKSQSVKQWNPKKDW